MGLTNVLDDAVVVRQLSVALPERLAVGAHLLLSFALNLASNLCQALPPILQSTAACQDTFTSHRFLSWPPLEGTSHNNLCKHVQLS